MYGNKIKIEEAIREFENKGFKLLEDTYVDTKEKATCIDKYGYKYIISLSKLKIGRNPSAFGNGNPYTIDNIKLWLKINNKDLELISDTYINAKSKLIWQCKNDESHIIESTWDSIRSTTSNGCGFCLGKIKNTLDVFRAKLKPILPNVEVIGEYLGIDVNIECRCLIHNNTFITTPRYLMKGHGCKICTNVTVYTFETFKRRIEIVNNNIEILGDEYINNSTPIKCRCKKHNIVWSPLPANILSGSGCIECWKDSVSGTNNYRWLGGITPLNIHLRNRIHDWKKQSMVACNYKCDITGKRFDDIHHLYGFDQILEEVLFNTNIKLKEIISEYSDIELKTLENECIRLHEKYGLGVCLCREEHESFHKQYGYGNNTPEQYYEFKNNRLKQSQEAI